MAQTKRVLRKAPDEELRNEIARNREKDVGPHVATRERQPCVEEQDGDYRQRTEPINFGTIT